MGEMVERANNDKKPNKGVVVQQRNKNGNRDAWQNVNAESAFGG